MAMILSLLLCASIATPVAGRVLPDAPAPTSSREDDPPSETPEKLAAWPAPADAKALDKDVARLRKANTEEMGLQAVAALKEAGAAAAPALLEALAKERKEDAQQRILHVLTAVTEAPHTRLLAAEFAAKSGDVRVFALRRVANFPDPGVREAAAAAWASVVAQGEKADPLEAYAAALCLSSSGSSEALLPLIAAADKDWKDRGEEIRTATEPLRGDPAALALLAPDLAPEADRAKKVAALRILAGVGDLATAKRYVKPLLGENDNSIRVAAINACRGIVDGQLPIDKISVFEAVEAAKEWQQKL